MKGECGLMCELCVWLAGWLEAVFHVFANPSADRTFWLDKEGRVWEPSPTVPVSPLLLGPCQGPWRMVPRGKGGLTHSTGLQGCWPQGPTGGSRNFFLVSAQAGRTLSQLVLNLGFFKGFSAPT